MRRWNKEDGSCKDAQYMEIDNKEKYAIFEDVIIKHDGATIYCPKLDEMFRNLSTKVCFECGDCSCRSVVYAPLHDASKRKTGGVA